MKKNLQINDLINEGNLFSSENNKEITHNGTFSRATPEFLAWVSQVENYIYTNFDNDSGPVKLLSSVDKSKFDGYYLSEFNRELTKVKGAINSCKNLKPNKSKNENQIVSLIKNPFFWGTLVIVVGGAYKLGFDNGISKFDNEKQDFRDKNKILDDSLKIIIKENIKLKEKIKVISQY